MRKPIYIWNAVYFQTFSESLFFFLFYFSQCYFSLFKNLFCCDKFTLANKHMQKKALYLLIKCLYLQPYFLEFTFD